MAENFDPVLDAVLNDKPIAAVSPSQDAPEPGASPAAAEPVNQNNEPAAADTPPPAEPPVNPEPAAPEPSNDNWISEASKRIGMEFKSEDELKSLLNKAKGYDDLESRYTTLNQDFEKVKSERPEIANDYIRILNDMYAQGRSAEDIKAFEKINSAGELKDLPPLETVKLALQLRDGLTPEEADTYIKSQYKLDEEVYDEDAVAQSKVALKLNARKDAEYLDQFKAKVSENPAKAQEQDFERQIQEYTAKVTPVAKSIQDSLTAIKGVNLNGKQGAEAVTVDVPIPDEVRSRISDLVVNYAVANNVELNEQGVETLNRFARNVALIENWENMAIHIASKTEERIRAEFHNPSTINRGTDNPSNDAAVQAKQLEDFVLNL